MASKINIAVGVSAKSRSWKNQEHTWQELVTKLSTPVVTNESLKEYFKLSKTDQLKVKDVGGYVGGYLRGGRRKPENVLSRQLLTLDVDDAYEGYDFDFELAFECAGVIHGTHTYTKAKPRLRLIIPLDREVTPDEYSAISRKVAGIMGIEHFDNTTFEINRLMFWPSVSKDAEYYFFEQKGEPLCADEILAKYKDWTDSSAWPANSKHDAEINSRIKKQEDPTEKKGIVGAFCRTYDIHQAIETFLSDDYVSCAIDGRYTYTKGSAVAGLVTYDDKFAYSHHGTDPSSQQLCNAFDLVRLHKYGHLDPPNKTAGFPPSFVAMEEMCIKDANIKETLSGERFTNAAEDFEGIELEEDDKEWAKELEVDKRGKVLVTAKNVDLIIKFDPILKNAFKLNSFDGQRYLTHSMPWRKVKHPEPMKNVDYAGIRNHIERVYGISSALKVDDSLALLFEKNSYHPIQDFLKGAKWDGSKRVDSLLIDYFGSDDNAYTREAIRKMLVGAVARVMNPGCKFDLVLTLVGNQGTGKSTFLNKLGGKWFSDTFMTVQGKEALEQIQGAWLIEIAELAGFRKADLESVKHFISKQVDQFRPAYARVSETYPRQCVFFATTNTKDFLKDPSGNRRFMPVDVNIDGALKDVWDDLDEHEVQQIWAEAYQMYLAKEPLYLSKEAEKLANTEQRKHSETDERTGMIVEYLEKKLPENWDTMDTFARRMYLEDENSEGTVTRDFVCVAEVWCECLGKAKEDISRYNTRELNDILRSLEGWTSKNSTKNFKLYGKQKFYSRL